MNYLSDKIYRYIIFLVVIAPITGFLTIKILGMDYKNVMSAFIFCTSLLIVIEKYKYVQLKIPRYLLYLTLFWIYTVLSDIFIVGKALTLKYLYADRIFSSIIILFLIENMDVNKNFIHIMLRISRWVIYSAVIIIVLQQVINPSFLITNYYKNTFPISDSYEQRLASIYSWVGPGLTVGFCFIPVLSILIAHYLKNEQQKFWIFYFLGLIFVFLQKSRWIMLNYFLLFLMIPISKRFSIKVVITLIVNIVIIIILFFISLSRLDVPVNKIIDNRILETQRGGLANGSAFTRVIAIQTFIKLFPENIMLGKGSYKYGIGGQGHHDPQLERVLNGRSSQIHVGYLSLLYYYGLLGGIPYLLFLYYFMLRIFKIAQKTNFWGVFFALLGFVLANFTLVYFSIFEMGIIIALVYNKYLESTIHPV